MSKQKNRFRIADLKVTMETIYDRTLRQAMSYKTDEEWPDEEAEALIEFPEGYIEKKQQNELKNLSMDNAEYMCSGSLFYRFLLKYNGLMLHSSGVVVDGYAYLFSADSGTGKSTHTGMWIKHFGERAYIINDDKPALRKVDGEWFVYGTPWSGKTDLNKNAKVKLGGIVFIERSKDNWIKEITPAEALPLFFAQTTRKIYKEENMDVMLGVLSQALTENPIYKMGCNISDEAVVTAYEKIRRV